MQLELLAFSGGTVKGTAEYENSERVVYGHGRYADPVARNNVFTASDTTFVTIAAGLTTAPTNVTLFNPIGSGVFCSVLAASLDEGTLVAAAAIVWIGVNPSGSVTAVTGTSLPPQTARGGLSGSRVIVMTGTIALPALPTIIADLGVALHGALTSQVQCNYYRWFDGAIGVGPGGALSIQMSTASGAGSAATWIWEEIPMYGTGPSQVA